MMKTVRPRVALTSSTMAILNRPENIPEREGPDYVIRLFQKVSAEPQRFKSPGQGADPGPSQGSSRIPPPLPPMGI